MTTARQNLQRVRGAMMKAMPGMITCRQFDNFICDYLDGALPPAQHRVFQRHLRLCADCRAYLADYQKAIELHRQALTTAEPPAPEDAPPDLIQAILQARQTCQAD